MTAELLYHEYLDRHARGDGIDFDRFVEETPVEFRTGLRLIHSIQGFVDEPESDLIESLLRRLPCQEQQLPIPADIADRREFSTQAATYTVVDTVHRSLVSVVLEATGPNGVRVALKTPARPTLDDPGISSEELVWRETRQRVRRLWQEARALRTLAGMPGIPRLVDRTRVPPQLLVLEWIDGWNLSERLERGRGEGRPRCDDHPLFLQTPDGSPRDRCSLLAALVEVGRILTAAHDRNLGHRDVCPANIRVGADGRAWLLDWGVVAHLASQRGASRSEIVGTPCYVAPEQAAGAPPSSSADIYGWGATLYHVLSGSAPGTPTCPEPEVRTLRRVIDTAPPSLNAVAPGIPRLLADVCDRAMARDPARRFASAMDASEALREALLRTGGESVAP